MDTFQQALKHAPAVLVLVNFLEHLLQSVIRNFFESNRSRLHLICVNEAITVTVKHFECFSDKVYVR